MNTTRFAIVGCGVIAPSHATSISKNPRAELVAVCDVIKEKAEELAKTFGAAHVYTEFAEMVKRDDIDVVCICTPSGLHAEMAVIAAEAGKHILCEKPLEITRDAMARMIGACRERGVKLGCVFQRRLMPEAIAAKAAFLSGEFGKPVLCDAYLKYYRSPEYYKSAGWRGTWEMDGGGALMNQGVHGIDLLLWMVGDVRSVSARTGHLARDIEVEDTAVALLEFTSGAFGVIEGTTSVYPAQDSRFELHGENGSIIFSDSGFSRWRKIGDDADSFPDVESLGIGGSSDPAAISSKGHYLQIDDMIDAIADDRDPMVTGESARKAVDLILAIYDAAASGKTVELT